MRDPFDPFDLSQFPAQRQTSSTPQAEVQLSYGYICRAHLLQAAIKPCQLDKNVTQQTAHTHAVHNAVFIGQTTLDSRAESSESCSSAIYECAASAHRVTVAQVTPSVTPARCTIVSYRLPCNPIDQPYRPLAM